MPVTLYDATVARFLQSLGAVSGYLEKGRAHCEDNNIDLNEIVETRLYPDMLPFRFQLIQVASHSIGAVRGALAGEYKPGPAAEDLDYRALQDLINDAQTGLQQVSAHEVCALEGKEVITHWRPFAGLGWFENEDHPGLHAGLYETDS